MPSLVKVRRPGEPGRQPGYRPELFELSSIGPDVLLWDGSFVIKEPGGPGFMLVELAPGEASLHHGWAVHGSPPNRSRQRRVGLSLQYLTPSARQLFDGDDSAMLVRGADRCGHFRSEPLPLSAEAIAFEAGVEERKHRVYDTADR